MFLDMVSLTKERLQWGVSALCDITEDWCVEVHVSGHIFWIEDQGKWVKDGFFSFLECMLRDYRWEDVFKVTCAWYGNSKALTTTR